MPARTGCCGPCSLPLSSYLRLRLPFVIVCGSVTNTLSTGTQDLKTCLYSPDGELTEEDCEAAGWVTCEWWFQGNITWDGIGSAGLTFDLIETSPGQWTCTIAAAFLCNPPAPGVGCVGTATYTGTTTGTGFTEIALSLQSNSAADCGGPASGTLTWLSTITFDRFDL